MRIALEPFQGSLCVAIPVLPIYAALWAINHGRAWQIGAILNGPVNFAVWVDIGDLNYREAMVYASERAQEISDQARELMVTSIYVN